MKFLFAWLNAARISEVAIGSKLVGGVICGPKPDWRLLEMAGTRPDFEEVVALLHFRRARRMIGTDGRHIGECVPEIVLVVSGTQWRRTFCNRADLFHVFIS